MLVICATRLPGMLHAWLSRPLWTPYTLLYVAIGGYAGAQLLTPLLDLLGVRHRYTRVGEEAVELLAGVFFVFAALERLRRAPHPAPTSAAAAAPAPVPAAPAARP